MISDEMSENKKLPNLERVDHPAEIQTHLDGPLFCVIKRDSGGFSIRLIALVEMIDWIIEYIMVTARVSFNGGF